MTAAALKSGIIRRVIDTSRALTTLLLLQNGYLYVPYSSMESIIEENKASYYQALRNSQKTFKTSDIRYDYWLNFFLVYIPLLIECNIISENIFE